jgi:Ca2+/Na+ antiporter
MVYLLLSQGVIVDKFLIKSLKNISHRYSISKGLLGILIAVGLTIPEFFIAIISFQDHGVKKVEFGMAVVLGGIAFSLSFVPAFAYWINFGFCKA